MNDTEFDWFKQFDIELWWKFIACRNFFLFFFAYNTQSNNTTLWLLELDTLFLKHDAPNDGSLKDTQIFPSNSFRGRIWAIFFVLIPDNNNDVWYIGALQLPFLRSQSINIVCI